MWMPFAILALIMGVLTTPGLIAQALEQRRIAREGRGNVAATPRQPDRRKA